MDLESVVDELYGLDPSQFTSTRDARSRAARLAGDRQLAGDIKALRKPSISAWALNQLARRRPSEVDQLLHLGEQLRRAQQSLSGEEMRALGSRRHRVIAGLGREVRAVAHEMGTRLSDTAEREVEESLEAALADPGAGEALRHGRLLRSLSHAGLDPSQPGGGVDLEGAVAGLIPSTRPPVQVEHRVEEVREDVRERAQHAVQAAATEVARATDRDQQARAHLEGASGDRRAADTRSGEASERVTMLERQVAEARQAADDAAEAAAEAAQAERKARQAAAAARERLEVARRRADAMRRQAEDLGIR